MIGSQSKLGDTVILNSGGPLMTITKLYTTEPHGEDDFKAECIWLEMGYTDRFINGTFPLACLRKPTVREYKSKMEME